MLKTNYFYLPCHGIQNLHESLSYKERSDVLILAFGVEGNLVFLSRVETLINYFVHTIGEKFLIELINHILLYGDKFYQNQIPKGQKYWKELNLVFDVYRMEIRSYPNNRLRVYSYRDKIQNLSLSKNLQNENFEMNFMIDFKKMKKQTRPFPFEKSYYLYDINKINKGIITDKKEEYRLYLEQNILFPKYDTMYENTPIDLYEIHNKKYIPIMDIPLYPKILKLKDVCEIIKVLTPPKSRNILFLSACKGYHKNMMEITGAYQVLQSEKSLMDAFRNMKLRDAIKRKKELNDQEKKNLKKIK